MKPALIIILLLLSNWLYSQKELKAIYDSAYSIGLKNKNQGVHFFQENIPNINSRYISLPHYVLAQLHNKLGFSLDTVDLYYEKAHNYALSKNEDSLAFESIYDLAITYRRAGYQKIARAYYNKARQFAAEHELIILEGDALNSIGIIHYRNYEYAEALTYYLKAKQIYLESGNPAKIAKIYNNIGIIYKIFNHYDKAIEYYQKSIDIRKANNIPARFNPYFNLN
ncbi:MAG: tetratricopeptide repeat protein, partial [Bacteroidota bacterium]